MAVIDVNVEVYYVNMFLSLAFFMLITTNVYVIWWDVSDSLLYDTRLGLTLRDMLMSCFGWDCFVFMMALVFKTIPIRIIDMFDMLFECMVMYLWFVEIDHEDVGSSCVLSWYMMLKVCICLVNVFVINMKKKK